MRRLLAAVVILSSAPAVAQTTATVTESAWVRAVDHYLAGDKASAVSELRNLEADDIAFQSRRALVAWLASAGRTQDPVEWRRAVRRAQGAAVLPLDALSALSTERVKMPAIASAYEAAALDAWQRLGEIDDDDPRASVGDDRNQPRRFRDWWQVAHLQFLMNVGRYSEFAKQADQFAPPRNDDTLRAEFYVLRGMAIESQTRTLPAGDSNPNPNMRPVPRPGMNTRGLGTNRFRDGRAGIDFDAAAEWYRRALDASPGHVDAVLHLGRVLLDLRRPADAAETLQPLLGNPCASTACALAALFTGEAHEMREVTTDAAQAYVLASTRFDVRQPALIALMQLSTRDSAAADGPALIGQFANTMPLATREGPDAWSTYLSGRRQDVEAVLRPLREAMTP